MYRSCGDAFPFQCVAIVVPILVKTEDEFFCDAKNTQNVEENVLMNFGGVMRALWRMFLVRECQ